MKVAIITITVGANYGNKLQNYALGKFLNNMGVVAETVPFYAERPKQKKDLKHYIKKIYYFVFKGGLKKSVKDFFERKVINRRYVNFNNFQEKYIPQSNFSIKGDKTDSNLVNCYDYFICGSDQIWNPHFHTTTPVMFLDFVPKQRSIAYSASFGISDIEEPQASEYGEYLKRFRAISVREQAGVDIVKKISGCQAELLIDPTMLLTCDEWMKIEKKPSWYNGKPYVFTYYLGDLSQDIQRKIKNICSVNNWELIELTGENVIKNKNYYVASPDEFIWLIRNSKLVFTDSFHASVFSIILRTPFVVCDRKDKTKSMSSRIDTLLSKFDFESRRYENVKEDQLFDIDFSHTDKIFEKECEKSLNFLKNALSL